MKDRFSYYDILGLPSKASDEDIKRAYLALAKKHHPDHNPHNRIRAERNFQAILEAYNALKTREKRATYNRKLRSIAENDNRKSTNNSLFSRIGELFSPPKSSNAGHKQNETRT